MSHPSFALTAAVNRLDRLTSGLMILALSGPASRDLAEEFKEGKVGKEYIARVRGCFPEEPVTVDQPLLTVDRQMGLVIVAPQGKVSAARGCECSEGQLAQLLPPPMFLRLC